MSYSIMDIIFQDRSEAEKILDTLKDLLERFGSVRVMDYYDLSDLPGDEEDKYREWTDLRKAKVVHSSWSEGYFIDFSECPIREDITTRGHMHLGNGYMADAFRYALPYIKFRKENEKMADKINYNVPCTSKMMTKLDYEISVIRDEYDKKMSELEVEREQKIEELKKKHDREEYVELCKGNAFRAKAKFDALVEAGFTDDEAKAMIMIELKNY